MWIAIHIRAVPWYYRGTTVALRQRVGAGQGVGGVGLPIRPGHKALVVQQLELFWPKSTGSAGFVPIGVPIQRTSPKNINFSNEVDIRTAIEAKHAEE